MLQKYEIKGTFAQNAYLFERLDTALEIIEARHDHPEMRGNWYRTGDTPIYTRHGNSAILTFSKYPLILNNLEQAISQLRKTNNYTPSQEELRKALEQGIVEIDLSKVRFIQPNDQYDRFLVDTLDPSLSELKEDEQKLVRVPHGEGNILKRNFKMLDDAGIRRTAMFTLTNKYVINTVPEGSAIAGLCRLGGFDGDSSFGAGGWGVGGEDDWLRGVRRREVAEGTQKSPQETTQPTLEQLAGKAEDNGQGFLVIPIQDIPQEIYTFLTAKP